jgi:hypothetical protein
MESARVRVHKMKRLSAQLYISRYDYTLKIGQLISPDYKLGEHGYQLDLVCEQNAIYRKHSPHSTNPNSYLQTAGNVRKYIKAFQYIAL